MVNSKLQFNLKAASSCLPIEISGDGKWKKKLNYFENYFLYFKVKILLAPPNIIVCLLAKRAIERCFAPL